ncbi:MAG: FixH family protein [Gemmatimonas sp.]
MTAKPLTRRPLTGRTVLLCLLGFFAVVAGVDASFIYLAEKSFPGLTTEHAYENGLAYNRVLAAAEAQRALGWTVSAATAEGALTVRVVDRNGAPVESPRVVAEIRRPAEDADDRAVVLDRAAPGSFVATAALGAPGNWDVRIRIRRDDGADYVVERRFTVKP